MNKIYWVAAIAVALATASCTKATISADQAQSTVKSTSKNQIVATYNGKKITLQELDDSIIHEIHDLRRQSLETMIVQALLAKEAKMLGKSEDEYLKSIASAVENPSEDELHKVYESNKKAFGNRPFEKVKAMLAARQKQSKQQKAVMRKIEDLKKKAHVCIQLPTPRTTVEANGPSKGPVDAPVTIVEFSDFQCHYCSQAHKTVDQLVNAYHGKVRLVFRDFPLPFHNHAAKAAEAGLCAESQGKFWEMHDWMFSNQDKLSVEALKEGAASLGIDRNKFNRCLDFGETTEKVNKNVQAAQKAGVKGTPTFFVNGILLSGNQSFDDFKKVIDEELQSRAAAH